MTRRGFTQPNTWLPYELACIGGYCDASSFVLTRTFTGHVTGNLVLAAIAIVGHEWRSVLAHLFAISAFLVGTVLSLLLVRQLQLWTSSRLVSLVMLIEGTLIASGSLPFASGMTHSVGIFVILVSLALGLQNGVLTRIGGASIHTTYLTGTITSLISTETGSYILKLPPSSGEEANTKARLFTTVWISFALGAVFGATMAVRFKALGLLGASGLLGLSALKLRS